MLGEKGLWPAWPHCRMFVGANKCPSAHAVCIMSFCLGEDAKMNSTKHEQRCTRWPLRFLSSQTKDLGELLPKPYPLARFYLFIYFVGVRVTILWQFQASSVCLQHRRPNAYWATLQEGWLQGKGGHCPPLLQRFQAPPQMLHLGLGPPAQGRYGAAGVGPGEAMRTLRGLEHFHKGRLRGHGLFSLEKKKPQGDHTGTF